jgi:ATP-dependent DNA helicase RecQ
MTIHEILLKYFGHAHFRPLQEEIILSVLQQNDTLALLPTGGGKSVCFQVPALAMEGLCIVISPLIALMKDQVENLLKKDIKAVAISSAMTAREIDIALDNCIYGDYKFLYMSPERLKNELFLERLKKMKVSLLAIDEAHCISQWGYDFRPSYLNIADIREKLTDVPIIALTATATPEVIEDVQAKLLFKKGKVFKKSFVRENVAYIVLYEEDKLKKLLRIATKQKGCGVVYVRNRKKTKDIAYFLNQNNISADYYHAGLPSKERAAKQDAWIKNKTRIIVATNAFGMGIDKPDVRFVVHMDLPDSLEAYFQEAGRGGRDEKKAFAILLYSNSDRLELKDNIVRAFPSIDEIKQVYNALGNYFQIPIGNGEGLVFDFDIQKFSDVFNLNILTVYNSLNFLERQEYISITESFYQPSRINFIVNKEDLYKFQIANKSYDSFIKFLLRSHGGLFETYIKISESQIAAKTKLEKSKVVKVFQMLHQYRILDYIPQSTFPKITYTTFRVDTRNFHLSKQVYSERKSKALENMNHVIRYATEKQCRNILLLEYFGEKTAEKCRNCDVCLDIENQSVSEDSFFTINEKIKILLQQNPLSLNELIGLVKNHSENQVLKVVQWQQENELLKLNQENKLIWINNEQIR